MGGCKEQQQLSQTMWLSARFKDDTLSQQLTFRCCVWVRAVIVRAGRLKTRDLTSRDHQKRRWTTRQLFGSSVKLALHTFHRTGPVHKTPARNARVVPRGTYLAAVVWGCCICLEQSAGDSTIVAVIASFPQ